MADVWDFKSGPHDTLADACYVARRGCVQIWVSTEKVGEWTASATLSPPGCAPIQVEMKQLYASRAAARDAVMSCVEKLIKTLHNDFYETWGGI